jgi:hypothetical protein
MGPRRTLRPNQFLSLVKFRLQRQPQTGFQRNYREAGGLIRIVTDFVNITVIISVL